MPTWSTRWTWTAWPRPSPTAWATPSTGTPRRAGAAAGRGLPLGPDRAQDARRLPLRDPAGAAPELTAPCGRPRTRRGPRGQADVSRLPDASPTPGRPRVALVHDWLTGMRGGEKVLEALAGLFPEAPIYTLFHFPGSVSPAIECHPIHTSFLQRAPAVRRAATGATCRSSRPPSRSSTSPATTWSSAPATAWPRA